LQAVSQPILINLPGGPRRASNNNNHAVLKAVEEKQKQEELEKKIKKSKGYSQATKRLINLSDQFGKTALHYATQKGNVNLVRTLLTYKAITVIRDYKKRVSIVNNHSYIEVKRHDR